METKINFTKQKFSILSDMVYKAKSELLMSVKTELEKKGEQSMLFYNDDTTVPINYINEYCDTDMIFVDKVRVENNIVVFHETYSDAWYPISTLDTDATIILISYIDWKE